MGTTKEADRKRAAKIRRRGARMARREKGACSLQVTAEQRSKVGCIDDEMAA